MVYVVAEETVARFKFIDLFAGIGGFHQAMEQLGGECVFASEIDEYAIETYKANYGLEPHRDIRLCDTDEDPIPEHDVLCAGFPCQTFSKAGKQLGFQDETKGTLFFEIERILKRHHSKYIILENVRNLVSHDHGNTWKTIYSHLKALGYRLTPEPLIVSPHQFGVPQLRERVVILGLYDPANVDDDLDISFDVKYSKDDNSIFSILENEPVDKSCYLDEYKTMVLDAWDEFYQGVDLDVIGFPVWAEWFKREPLEDMPRWKQDFINKNNDLYKRNNRFIDGWLRKHSNLEDFAPTHRKFEWQAGKEYDSVWDCLIQLRPSGVRVKKPTCAPALVAIVQMPIVGPRRRIMTVREAARLQSFPDSFIPCDNKLQAYKQFGNAVNVEVIKHAAEQLFNYKEHRIRLSA